MKSDDILALLDGPCNPMHDTYCQTIEIYWFHRLIEQSKIYDEMIREGKIIDYYIVTEAEPFLGMYETFFTVVPAIRSIHLKSIIKTTNKDFEDLK